MIQAKIVLLTVMINDTKEKYEKRKTPDLRGNPYGKKPRVEEKSVTMNFVRDYNISLFFFLTFSFYKSRTAGLWVGH